MVRLRKRDCELRMVKSSLGIQNNWGYLWTLTPKVYFAI